jgi:hypothetical protein
MSQTPLNAPGAKGIVGGHQLSTMRNFMRLFLVAILLVSVQAPSQNPTVPDNHSAQAKDSQQRPQSPPVISQGDVSKSAGGESANELLTLGLTFAIALAAITQAGVAIWQARVYERQYKIMGDALVASNESADAAQRSLAVLEKLERPFLMIDLRSGSGGERRNQVWTVNKGKVPAQIIWWNNAPVPIFPKQDEELPQDYNYGFGYYDPGAAMFNEEWLAPQGEKCLCSFNASFLEGLAESTRRELNDGRRILYYLSALKYKGMLNDTIFESRWCFSWPSPRGLYLSGPYGYNKYT